MLIMLLLDLLPALALIGFIVFLVSKVLFAEESKPKAGREDSIPLLPGSIRPIDLSQARAGGDIKPTMTDKAIIVDEVKGEPSQDVEGQETPSSRRISIKKRPGKES